MNPQEQEQLFKKLQVLHPQWPNRFISGYVAGAQDEDRHAQPSAIQRQKAVELDHYALGYLVGFAMYRGPDAEAEPWFHLIGLIVEDARREA
jgi:hypothetical protein